MPQNPKYNHREIEKKWRANWEKRPINQDAPGKKKFYCLDMFPYPSDKGLHVGHWRGYVLSDVLSRYKILQGFHVLHPMGWDAFGLPTENYAIKTGVHPSAATADSVANMKRQLREICAVYDWSKEINTTDPGYYKWTQWIFVQMFKKGLAYEKEMPLNWCARCRCVLANEEAAGGVCDRCRGPVTKKNLRQWMLAITQYAERLLQDLDLLDWPEKVKKMQADWIGKSYGAEVQFALQSRADSITVFTTRPDTLFGATFMVLAPEHPLVPELTVPSQKEAVAEYVRAAGGRSAVDRMADKDKTGVFTGSYGINPFTGKPIPIWISDYVLIDYGTGAIMCVPGHDQRDFEFAKKFGLDIVQVILPEGEAESELAEAYAGPGYMINSGPYNGLFFEDAKDQMTEALAKDGKGKQTVNYKLRDWVFSRQRYWGEPIPVVHCDICGCVPIPEEDLPVILPRVENYQPTVTGESPLAAMEDWVNTTCPACGGPARRETNTMPQWAGSSWYFLRYADPGNGDALASPEALKDWLPVDYYVGGIEHAVLHLLYARFYTKFLFDIGAVDFPEPFTKLFNQGMILKDGAKMSKSKGNVVSPDELVERYGCDSLRMYELFVGPPEMDSEWDDSGIDGVYRFLNRLWRLATETETKQSAAAEQIRHRMIRDITTRLDNLHMNTVISGFMEYTNKLWDGAKTWGGLDRETLESLIVLLAPFAPHIAEELWEVTGHADSVFDQRWPAYDEAKMAEDTIEIVLQQNGKHRGVIKVAGDAGKDVVLAAARDALGAKLVPGSVVKEIYVPGKIVNFVMK